MGVAPPPSRHRLLTAEPRSRRLPLFIFLAGAAAVMVLFYVLLSLAPCSVGAARCHRGYQSAFSFDAELARNPAWMGGLPDAANLTALSIPGTHDTMTYGVRGADVETLQCQNWNLSTQMAAGLRYFDIRARLRDDELYIYHGSGFTGFSLADVLADMFAFLDANPSEAIVMRLKEEAKPIGDRNTVTFEQAFNRYRLSMPGAAAHIAVHDAAAPLPTLGALRSKILLLQNFVAKDGGPYGLAWAGPQMALEDKWIVPDVYHLADKWTAIRTALERASTAPLSDNSRLYLAHVSASVGVLPIVAAAGPINRSVTGMNDMTGQWLLDFVGNADTTRTGIVIFDFPGQKAIEAVLAWNVKRLAALGG
ncbi:1-phosphatidylinositol phosphodiesterase [Tolypocladium ophioglossoides CBS 100239]|uniref:1-phosphatidylinositol phosphodiesterase n=1 Tax=Tolypocladium ophioglossoides (strain CBS 100239) TaxID=1163406 RepID=A0A0L0NDL5_TOLOC|nr:1-phosphatidylinositol phosphodiesterase [Tolypocladium ophioglossoides CBS 100239]